MKQTKSSTAFVIFTAMLLTLLLQGCASTEDTDDDNDASVTPFTLVAPSFSESNITLESYVDGAGWYEESADATNAEGELALTEPSFADDTWYRFTLSGGTLLDEDFDGVEDDSVDFDGRLRAIAKGSWLTELGGINLNMFTEVSYTHVLHLLNETTVDWDDVESNLEALVSQIVLGDINSENEITQLDILNTDFDRSLVNALTFQHLSNISELTAAGFASQLVWMPYIDDYQLEPDGETIENLVFNSDGTVLYASSYSNGLYIYDLVTGDFNSVATSSSRHDDLVLDESNNRVFLDNGGPDNGVFIIDLETLAVTETLLSGERAYAIAINDEGDTLYYFDGTDLNIYDIEEDTTTTVSTSYIQTIQVTEDGNSLLLNGNDFVASYNLLTESYNYNISVTGSSYATRFNEAGTTAYVANYGNGLAIVDLESEAYSAYEAPDGEDVYNVFLMEDETLVLVVSEYGAFTFDIESSEYVDGEYNIVFESDSEASAYSDDHKLFVGGEYLEMPGQYTGVDPMTLIVDYSGALIGSVFRNENNSEVLFGIYGGPLGFYDETSDTLTYLATTGNSGGVTLSSDGQTYFVGTAAGIDLVDVATRALTNIPETDYYSEALEHTTTSLLYGHNNTEKGIDVYDLTDNSFVESVDMDGCSARDIAFDADQDYLYVACANANSGLRRYDVTAKTWETYVVDASYALLLSEDETTVYSSLSSQVSVLDIASGNVTSTYDGDGLTYTLTLWPEQNAILSGGNGGLYMHELDTGDFFHLHDNYSNRYVFNESKDTLYIGRGNDGFFSFDVSDF
jgi:WD40 repeat protein